MRCPASSHLVGLALLASACGSAPKPCLGARGCPSGTECLASRCVLEGSVPVDADTERVLLRPIAIAVATDEATDGVGPTVTLGNPAREAALYVRFPAARHEGTLEAAFLLLDQSAGVVTGPDLELEVSRAAEAWSGPLFSWSEQPGFSPPSARGLARSTPEVPIRVDVTDLLDFVADHPNRDHGFAIRALEATGPGLTLNTGVAGGVPPRLDLYFAPREARSKAVR